MKITIKLINNNSSRQNLNYLVLRFALDDTPMVDCCFHRSTSWFLNEKTFLLNHENLYTNEKYLNCFLAL